MLERNKSGQLFARTLLGLSDFSLLNQDLQKKFEKEYAQFLFSELLLEAMEEEHVSVRELAEKSGVSTSIIQNMRSMKPTNITITDNGIFTEAVGVQVGGAKRKKKCKLIKLKQAGRARLSVTGKRGQI